MTRLLLALLSVGAAVNATAGEPVNVYPSEPPAEIQRALSTLRGGTDTTQAVKFLAARDDAAPYLRDELQLEFRSVQNQDLRTALGAIEERAYKRNLARTAAWLTDKRVDLVAEFLSGCRDRDALELAEKLSRLCKEFCNEFLGNPNRVRMFTYKRTAPGPHLSGASIVVPFDTDRYTAPLIRTRDCTFETWEKYAFLVIAAEIKDPLTPEKIKRGNSIGRWNYSTVCVNSSMTLGACEDSIIVCTGDVELVGRVDRSVILAGGSIRAGKGTGAWAQGSYLGASGDIVLRQGHLGDNQFLAGGSVKLAKPVEPSGRLREKEPELQFGIRFLDPKEFRIEFAAQNGGVQVMDVLHDSPFAKHGVQEADIITSVDGVDVTTMLGFTRQLRRGLLQESVVLNIRRGKERLTRIVFLDGIPVPIAPAPRPKP